MPATLTPRLLLAGLSLAAASLLAGCAPLVVGGTAATTALVASDRRTAGEQVEDKAIDLKVGSEVRREFGEAENIRVLAHSYAGQVLLVGDVPTEQVKQRIGTLVAGIDKVQRVFNELRVGEVTPLSVRTNDTWITSKVRTALINTKEVPSLTIDITTERGVVYLQGKVTEAEGQRAAIAASGVSGVNKVVKLFEIISPESLNQPGSPAPIPESGNPSVNTPSNTSTATDTGGVQALPVQ